MTLDTIKNSTARPVPALRRPDLTRSRRQAVRRAAAETLERRRLLSFSPAAAYPVASAPAAVVTADLNGDGRLDVLTADYDDNSVSVLLGNPGGTFQPALTSPAGPHPSSVATGDLNADGAVDVVVANDQGVSVLLGNGNGTYRAPTNTTFYTGRTSVAVGDLNADGKLNLVVATNDYYPGSSGPYGGYPGFWLGQLNVILGNGNGSLGAPSSAGPAYASGRLTSVALADVNGDGKLDAAAVDDGGWWGNGAAWVAAGTAGGLAPVQPVAYLGYPTSVAAKDLNGDGKADLVVSSQSDNSVNVLLANANAAGFQASQRYAASGWPLGTAVTDVNGDGTLDIVTATAGTGVLLGAGGGTFRPAQSSPTGSGQPWAVAVGDFNGDGRPDAVTTAAGSRDVSVLLNDGNWLSPSAPSVSIGHATVTEGNVGTVIAHLPVVLSAAASQVVTVNYSTADATATAAGGDYVAASGTVTFAPGETSKTIPIAVTSDRLAETTESLSVTLRDATNAFIGGASGTVTILDDEPRVSIGADVTVVEGNVGTRDAAFTVSLSAASDAPVSVNYSTAEGDTNWYWGNYYEPPVPATSDVDFQAQAGTLTFAAGETRQTIVVRVNGDRSPEAHETLSVDLSAPVGAAVERGHTTVTITDDEPVVSVTGGTITEGNTGTTSLPFTISLNVASDVPLTVAYATADATATAGRDYVAKSGSVIFAPGETRKTVNVSVNGDRVGEDDEVVYVYLSAVAGASVIGYPGYGLIVDNEPRININSVSLPEGKSGTKLMTFTVTLSAAYDQTVTVRYATKNDSATTGGGDYVAKSGTLTFSAGQTSKTITVTIKGDTKREWDEEFYVLLSAPSANARIENAYGYGTILNDDGWPR